MMSAKEVYAALVELVIHSESISWNRFYNFLMGNSILVLAWATIFANCNCKGSVVNVVLVAICVLGGLSGVAWAALGWRGRTFLHEYLALADRMEGDNTCWPPGLQKYKPFGLTLEVGDTGVQPWARSRPILVVGPLLFTFLYVVLLVASIIGCAPSDSSAWGC
jgi:hypothetical protein